MLSQVFLDRPFAHRGLHDATDNRPENSLAAFRAAIALGYGIELDLQISQDGQAMVFHDYDLRRLCGVRGTVNQTPAKALQKIPLLGGTEGIPTLEQVLDLVDGQVPLLIEIKDQDLRLGPNIGALEDTTARILRTYGGPMAVMSFNPHSMARMARMAPDIPRGLTTCNFDKQDWLLVPDDRRAELARLADVAPTGSCFVSHQHDQMDNPFIARLKTRGLPIFCWTIRSPNDEATARKIADNITFEGYLP